MSLQVIGAGLGRTGTSSLKLALQMLLKGRCYHMSELFKHPKDASYWRQAATHHSFDWEIIFHDYVATVDWPGASFWWELRNYYPDALILLSVRDPEEWWDSASRTIFKGMKRDKISEEIKSFLDVLLESRWTCDTSNKESAIRMFSAHNADVIKRTPQNKLIVWKPGDGWLPICERLEVLPPRISFPHVNRSLPR